MYNLRYHLASLVSIFIALAIGIVLGGLIVDNSSAFDTAALIEDLRTEYNDLRAENTALASELDAYDEFGQGVVADTITDRLVGRTTLVLGSSNAVMEEAVRVIEAAGGNVLLVVVDSGTLTNEGAPATAALGEQFLPAGVTSEAVAAALAAEWTDREAEMTPVTDALVADGIIKYSGSLPAGLTGVVNTAAAGGNAEPFALDISVALSRIGTPIVGASMLRGAGVVAEASWERGVAGTNLLGSPIGSYTIVALLTGAEPGLYGTLDGSSAVFAPMPMRAPLVEAPAEDPLAP